MKWKKLGKIFDPTKHELKNGCTEFAQSPQALVFDNFIRIYYSTRQKEKNGKYLSRIAFVDFDKSCQKILSLSNETVIDLGELGCFDEHGIFPINVLKDRDESRILAYTCGWSRRVSVSVETSIGLAISTDNGRTFSKMGNGPILTSSLDEPFLVGDAFVSIFGAIYHMWYIYGTQWLDPTTGEAPARIYKIGHAVSEDGISWAKDGKQLISDRLNRNECQALPTVKKFSGKYHMFFCYRESTDFRTNKDRGYRIGYAFSEDLVNWTRNDNEVGLEISPTGWDSDMLCYPNVFQSGDDIYMLYNGNEFGRLGFGLAKLEK